VLAGETLEAIAHRYSTPASSISAANHKVQAPEEGDVLVIPAGYPQRAAAHPSSARAGVHTGSRAATRASAPALRKSTHRTSASRTATARSYKTAALAAKRRATAN